MARFELNAMQMERRMSVSVREREVVRVEIGAEMLRECTVQ